MCLFIHYQVNYLSQVLLATKLIPVMKQSGEDCRIVLVASFAHTMAGTFDLTRTPAKRDSNENFDSASYYGKSKLYQVAISILCSHYRKYQQKCSKMIPIKSYG